MTKAVEVIQTIKAKLENCIPRRQEKSITYLKQEEIKEEIRTLLTEMDIVRGRFDDETDFDLIEADIWQLNSLEARYKQALRRCKSAYEL